MSHLRIHGSTPRVIDRIGTTTNNCGRQGTMGFRVIALVNASVYRRFNWPAPGFMATIRGFHLAGTRIQLAGMAATCTVDWRNTPSSPHRGHASRPHPWTATSGRPLALKWQTFGPLSLLNLRLDAGNARRARADITGFVSRLRKARI